MVFNNKVEVKVVQLSFGNGDDKPNPIYTRAGWEISQGNPQQFTQRQVEIRAEEILKMRQNLILATVSNYPYNCVGLVFASRRAFIEAQHIPRILFDDDYIKIQRLSAKIGDIVTYQNNNLDYTHVGLIVSVYEIGSSRAINILSKWGSEAEFIHDEQNVLPILGRPTEYWTLSHDKDI